MPGFCFAQQDVVKPAADDCPSWKKKSKESSKAEYLYFLRTNKAKDQLAVSNSAATPARTYSSKSSVKPANEVNPFFIPRKERNKTSTAASKKNTAKAEDMGAAAGIAEEEEQPEPKAEEISTPTKEEPMVNAPVEKAKETALQVKEETTASVERPVIKEKPKKEKKFKNRSVRSSGKVKSCKPGNAGKCPDF